MTALGLWKSKPSPHSKDAGYRVTTGSRIKILVICCISKPFVERKEQELKLES
jgi:hypothetical protein